MKENIKIKSYGKELILDLHECNSSKFTRKSIKKFFEIFCELIDMTPEKLVWWDELYVPEEEKETEDHLVGTSAVQFIRTSNITIHTLDILRRVYLNIFTCKDFKTHIAVDFCVKWFDCKIIKQSKIIERR